MFIQATADDTKRKTMRSVPSGKRLQFAIENGHRNSGFIREKW